MKGTDRPGPVPAVPPARNGGQRKKANGPAARQFPAAPQPLADPLVTHEAAPVDVAMWCLHPAMWFQPELAPSAPGWTGLTIERRSRIPAPDFLFTSAAPTDCPASLDNSRDGLAPAAHPQVPNSGNAPTGWDPRTVYRKDEHR